MKYDEFKLHYLTEDGLKLTGIISMPRCIKPCPIVILAHGFCADKNENGFFVQAAESFNKSGYAVMRFDFRGCGESEGAFEEVRLKDKILDIKATLSFIKSCNYNLDRQNIGFIGFSLGATVGLLSNLDRINEIKTSAFWAPAFFPNIDMYPRYDTDEVLNEISRYGFLKKSNVKVGLNFIKDLGACDTEKKLRNFKKPAIIIHGSRDQRINPRSSERGFGYLKGHKCVQFIKGASHSFNETDEFRKQVIDLTISWFNYYFGQTSKLYRRQARNRSAKLVSTVHSVKKADPLRPAILH